MDRCLDLFLQAVIQVVMDLLDQLLVIEGVEVKFTIIAHRVSPGGILEGSQ